jgi:hypothetical protein
MMEGREDEGIERKSGMGGRGSGERGEREPPVGIIGQGEVANSPHKVCKTRIDVCANHRRIHGS